MLSINDILLESRYRWLLPALFGGIGLLAAVDIVADIMEGTDFAHVLLEVLVFLVAIGSALVTVLQLIREARHTRLLIDDMQHQITSHQQEASKWQQENRDLMQGLGASINRQFERWQFTETEKEVALFLLKGLSHKEIAILRKVSQATARQQATAVYHKAGVSGRNELAAFFLEELTLPVDEHQQE